MEPDRLTRARARADQFFADYSPAEAERWGRDEFLHRTFHSVFDRSEAVSAYDYDALLWIAAEHIEQGRELPDWLGAFAARHMRGAATRPASPAGRRPWDQLWLEHRARLCVRRLRNEFRLALYGGAGREGESACGITASAAREAGVPGVTLNTVTRIMRRR